MAMDLWQMLASSGAGFRSGAGIYSGIEADRAASYTADSLDVSGGQAVAASQRTAQEEERRAKLLQSRAQAVAAASGAGASDPTVVDIISQIAGQGAYRSQIALYDGLEQQRLLRAKADAARYQGKSARVASEIGAITSAGKTFFDKYGGGGPSASNAPMSGGAFGWGADDPVAAAAYNTYGAGP